MDKLFNIDFNNIFCIILILILIYLVCNSLNINSDTFISGFGLSTIQPTNTNNAVSTLIPTNLITKSTDFKLLSLTNQLRYRFFQPKPTLKNTRTEQGIISTGIQEYANIVVFPGNSDYKLYQNNKLVWPIEILEQIDMKKYTTVSDNNNGHMNSIFTLLSTLNYKHGFNLNTITYNFINFDINTIVEQFKSFINKNTMIIAYDFGCTIANIVINKLNKYEKSKIYKLLYICPTIGGVPLSIKDYFENSKVRKFKSLLMSFPHQVFYDKPVIIYNSKGYLPKYLSNLIEKINESPDLLNSLTELNELSIKDTDIPCVIVANNEFNTPISYNYKNNLLGPPESYLPENNNFIPTVMPDPVLVGLQTPGDQVVPFSSILKLKNMWPSSKLEIIKDKNHFSILKSYELGLLITTLI